MILCVTLNPCLDRTLTVPAWSPGDSVRGLAVHEVVGGKGNNVARALKRLGRPEVRPVTFLGGAVGRRCEDLIRGRDGFDPIAIASSAPTREILTVRTEGSDLQTAFFDPDPAVTEDEAEALRSAIEAEIASGRVEALTLSGSSPSPATREVFSDLVAIAQSRQVPTFLDTYGAALAGIWGFWPNAIQVNLREASLHLGLAGGRPNEQDIVSLLDHWSRRGVRVCVVTDGPNQFLARIGRETYRVTPPEIRAVNPIGSGDSFLAGLVDGHLAGLDGEILIRLAVGCASANASVWDAGALDRNLAERLAGEVVVNRMGGR